MPRVLLAVVAVLMVSPVPVLHAQRDLAPRTDRLLDQPPFDRATWGVIVMDTAGRVLYERNADRLFIPASNTKLVVTAVASVLLPEDLRVATSLYATGPLVDGVLQGNLIIYGRGDPTFSERCYGVDTLALGACETMWSRMEALADRFISLGVRRITGSVVADGSYFDSEFVHPRWNTYDLNWWYAAPVSALAFNDNTVNVRWGPGSRAGAPARISFEPALGNFLFENRTITVDSGEATTIDFFRAPGADRIWAEGTVAANRSPHTEYFALPDPNLYFAQAFRAVLMKRDVSVGGPTLSTTDSMQHLLVRDTPALVTFESRSLADMLFPILNKSQNLFAEMLLKQLGKRFGDAGSWEAGLAVERRVLIDSMGIDSAAFSLSDASGLSSGNLITPRAFAQLLRYMWQHPRRRGFVAGLPRAGQRGSLRTRFAGNPLQGSVLAKTGSIDRVNTLSGYIERERGGPLIFSVMLNDHAARSSAARRQIDSVVVEVAR